MEKLERAPIGRRLYPHHKQNLADFSQMFPLKMNLDQVKISELSTPCAFYQDENDTD